MSFELFYRKECPYCKKVLDFINEKGIKHVKLTDISKNYKKFEEFRDKTKAGRNTVPVLRIKGIVHLYESQEIINFLSKVKFE